MVLFPEWPLSQVFSKRQSLLVWSLSKDFVEMCSHCFDCDEELLHSSSELFPLQRSCSRGHLGLLLLECSWTISTSLLRSWTGRFPLLMDVFCGRCFAPVFAILDLVFIQVDTNLSIGLVGTMLPCRATACPAASRESSVLHVHVSCALCLKFSTWMLLWTCTSLSAISQKNLYPSFRHLWLHMVNPDLCLALPCTTDDDAICGNPFREWTWGAIGAFHCTARETSLVNHSVS